MGVILGEGEFRNCRLIYYSTGDTLKLQILIGWKMKTFRAYSNIVFGGWDFALTNETAAELRHYNLQYEICVRRSGEKYGWH